MSRPMIQAAVTMKQLQQKMDTIGNNLSNTETTGYKNRQTEFASLLTQQIDNMTDPADADNRQTPDGIRVGNGARLDDVQIDLSPGAIKETERALDTALLQDNHLFQVQSANDGAAETLYTRDGTFYLSEIAGDNALMVTTKDGDPVQGMNGPITVEPGFESISINGDGSVTVNRAGETETAGILALAEAVRPNFLKAAGDNAFRLPEADELDVDPATIIQAVAPNDDLIKNGALEQSNVDMSKQMSDLVMTQRAYQFNARTITMGDQMSGLVNQLR